MHTTNIKNVAAEIKHLNSTIFTHVNVSYICKTFGVRNYLTLLFDTSAFDERARVSHKFVYVSHSYYVLYRNYTKLYIWTNKWTPHTRLPVPWTHFLTSTRTRSHLRTVKGIPLERILQETFSFLLGCVLRFWYSIKKWWIKELITICMCASFVCSLGVYDVVVVVALRAQIRRKPTRADTRVCVYSRWIMLELSPKYILWKFYST